MTSFGWKKKRQLSGNAASIFKKEGVTSEGDDQGVDWLTAAKKRKAMLLEDSQAKSKRLQDEGALLAENERYWEAIKYWDEAIELTPGSAVLYEMKSQGFLELRELFPSVEAAEKAVWLEPMWSVAWQTLARAQIGLGELEMALSSAQKSFHLDPTSTEVREDVRWIQELLKQKEARSVDLHAKEENNRNNILAKRRGSCSGPEEEKIPELHFVEKPA